MRKLSLLVPLLLLCTAPAWPAPDDGGGAKSRPQIGKVDVDYQHGDFKPALWHLTGSVKMKSDNYDLASDDLVVNFAPKNSAAAGASSLEKVTAASDPKSSRQVVAHIRRPLESEAYEIEADKAVYTPDTSRPGGGAMRFTGNVKVTSRSGFLAEPSISTTDRATVLLGTGDEYPQIQTGPAHITLTPAQ